jgi:hypothetical protein
MSLELSHLKHIMFGSTIVHARAPPQNMQIWIKVIITFKNIFLCPTDTETTRWRGWLTRYATNCSQVRFLTRLLDFVVVKVPCYNPEGRGFETRGCVFLSIYLILPAAVGLSVYSVTEMSSKNRKVIFLGSEATTGSKG